MTTVSLICTLKNEASGLLDFLATIDSQSRRPDEFVVVDGGSTDGTLDILASYAQARGWVTVLSHPGVNIAAGRNLAILSSKGTIIASTDAGCRLDAKWLETIVKPIEGGVAEVVGGGYEISYKTPFQRCLAAVVSSNRHKWDERNFLPSSRSIAFTRTAWEKAGGYPECLPYAEDTYFDLRLRDLGLKMVLRPNALVYWEARKDLPSVAKQYYRYHYWDMIAGNFLHRAFLTMALVGLIFILISLTLIFDWMVLPGAILFAFIFGFVRYGLFVYLKTGCKQCLVLSPAVAATILFSENLGRLMGLMDRLRSKIHRRLVP